MNFIFLLSILFFANPTLMAQLSQPPAIVLEQAKEMKDDGKYLQAQKLYEDVLNEGKWTKKQKKNIQKEYEEVNRKILFSPKIKSNSVLHTVKEGESLSGIARQYKTTMELIRKINGLSGDQVNAGSKLKVPKGDFTIQVDKSDNVLRLFLEDKPLKTYPVSTGKNNSTPTGKFEITSKVENPAWFYKGKTFPPNHKQNLIGTRWLGFDKKSYGIHGTTEPERIGQQASLGCVRMRNQDVEELYSIVPQGTEVSIQN